MTHAPVLVSVYHREKTFRKCIAALQANPLASETDLFVISDGAFVPEHETVISKIRNFVRTLSGFKKVHLLARPTNYGANRSWTEAFKEVFAQYDRLIALEDDVIVGQNFLQYMNDGLTCYENDKRVFAICGFKGKYKLPTTYKKDVFFVRGYSPWGCAFWKSKYPIEEFGERDRLGELQKDKVLCDEIKTTDALLFSLIRLDSEGKLKAADARICYYIFKNKLLCLFPSESQTRNIGFANDSMHCGGLSAIGHVRVSKKTCDVMIPVNEESGMRIAYYQPSTLLPLPLRFLQNLFVFGVRKTVTYYFSRLFSRKFGTSISSKQE